MGLGSTICCFESAAMSSGGSDRSVNVMKSNSLRSRVPSSFYAPMAAAAQWYTAALDGDEGAAQVIDCTGLNYAIWSGNRDDVAIGVCVSLRLGHPLQRCQPEIVSAVHERLITLAKARGILTNPGLIHHDVARGATRLQIPGVIEARLGPRRIAVPSQALIHYILVHCAFDRQAERGPPEYRAVPEHRIPALDFDILGVGVPARPPGRFDDMCPDPLTRCIDDQIIVGEQVGLLRLEACRPVDVRGAVGKIVFH